MDARRLRFAARMPAMGYGRYGIHGLGASGAQTAETIAFSGAATTVSILASLHAVIAGVAFAGPVGAAIAGIIAVGSIIASQFHGCGETCIQATQIANNVESALKKNLETYQSAPVHYASLQAAALNNFDTVWNALVQACSNPALGAAGKRCISERQRGGVAPWCPNAGHTGCDWFALYRDPIANDPHVVADPASAAQASSDISAAGGTAGTAGTVAGGSSMLPLLIGGGLIFFALASGGQKS